MAAIAIITGYKWVLDQKDDPDDRLTPDQPNPDSTALIAAYKDCRADGCDVYMVTARQRPTEARQHFQQLGADITNKLVTYNDIHPYPAIAGFWDEFIRAYRVDPHKSIYVDASPANLKAARDAGFENTLLADNLNETPDKFKTMYQKLRYKT